MKRAFRRLEGHLRQAASTGWWELPVGPRGPLNLHDSSLQQFVVAGGDLWLGFVFSSEIGLTLLFRDVREARFSYENDVDLPWSEGNQVTGTDASGEWYSIQSYAITAEWRSSQQFYFLGLSVPTWDRST